MAAGPSYTALAQTAQKTLLPTVSTLLRVAQPLRWLWGILSSGRYGGKSSFILRIEERAVQATSKAQEANNLPLALSRMSSHRYHSSRPWGLLLLVSYRIRSRGPCLLLASVSLLGVLFDPEFEGCVSIGNVEELLIDYTVSNLRS
jgi:hypothetical protein